MVRAERRSIAKLRPSPRTSLYWYLPVISPLGAVFGLAGCFKRFCTCAAPLVCFTAHERTIRDGRTDCLHGVAPRRNPPALRNVLRISCGESWQSSANFASNKLFLPRLTFDMTLALENKTARTERYARRLKPRSSLSALTAPATRGWVPQADLTLGASRS